MLLLIWTIVIYIVDPVGEFMINDDFAFTKALDTLRTNGILGPTWMGPQGEGGGPALIIHLLWGFLFSEIFGHSLTVLRLSVSHLVRCGLNGFFLSSQDHKSGRLGIILGNSDLDVQSIVFLSVFYIYD